MNKNILFFNLLLLLLLLSPALWASARPLGTIKQRQTDNSLVVTVYDLPEGVTLAAARIQNGEAIDLHLKNVRNLGQKNRFTVMKRIDLQAPVESIDWVVNNRRGMMVLALKKETT